MQNDQRKNMLEKIRLILKLENLDTYVTKEMTEEKYRKVR